MHLRRVDGVEGLTVYDAAYQPALDFTLSADAFRGRMGKLPGTQVMLIDYWALISHFSCWVGVMRVRELEQINFTNASRA